MRYIEIMGDQVSLFEYTKNSRTIIYGNLRFIRSDVPTYLTEKERQWMIDNNIITIVDLREETEQNQKPCPLRKDDAFHMDIKRISLVMDVLVLYFVRQFSIHHF